MTYLVCDFEVAGGGVATFEMNVARLINNNINNRGKQVCGVR